MRRIGFIYKLLRNGSEFARLSPIDGNEPNLAMTRSAEKKMRFSGVFSSTAIGPSGGAKEINWYSDEIQPTLVVNGVEHPLCVIMPSSPIEQGNGLSKRLSVDGYDRCARVETVHTEEVVHFSSGTEYVAAITQTLSAAGINSVISTPSSAKLQEDREDWNVGTPLLKIVNDLLSEINYAPLWFDPHGNAILQPAITPSVSTIDHILSDSPRDSRTEKIERLLPGYSIKTDVYSTPNVFICVCSNPDKDSDLVAVAVNDNPNSPISTVSRGRRISKEIRLNNIASIGELQAYADNLCQESMTSSQIISLSTALLPGWGVYDTTAVHYGGIDAICSEESWHMDLKLGGEMRHDLKKVVYNIG